jgi:ribosomal protein L13
LFLSWFKNSFSQYPLTLTTRTQHNIPKERAKDIQETRIRGFLPKTEDGRKDYHQNK